MKVRTKLIIGFSVIVALLWLIAIYAGSNFGNLREQFSAVEEKIIPGTIAMNDVENTANDAYHETMKYVIYDMAGAKEKAIAKLMRLQEIETRYFPHGTPASEESKAKQVMSGKITDFYFSAAIMLNLKERGASYEELLTRDRATSLPALLALQQEVNKRKAQYIEELATVKTSFDSAYNSGVRFLILSAGLITLLAIAAAIFTTRSIVRPLHALRKGTEMIAKGNLSYKVGTEARDEIGELSRAFDHMTQGLSTSMTSIENLNQEIAERKLAEEALANEAIRRRILIEQSSDGIVILDQNGKVYEANRRFAEMLGYSSEEVLYLYVWDWDTQWTHEQLLDMIHSVSAAGDHFETYHQRKDGTIYDVEISTNGATFAGQKLVFCVCRDITERKQIEKALRESEEKFSIAFRSSPDAIAITTLKDGRFIEVNDSYTRITGYTREEVIGRSTAEFSAWAKAEERARILRMLKEQGRVSNEEVHLCMKSGEVHVSLFSAESINIGGEPCMISVATDINERRLAVEALQQSEERFSKAFNASPNSIAINRLKDGTFIEVNDSFVRDKGYSRKEIIGHNSFELGIWPHAEDRDRIMRILEEQGSVRNETVEYRTKSGEIRTGLLSVEHVTLDNEPCALFINTDITQRRKAEEQLRLLSSITQQVSDSTIVLDPNFRITYMNRAAQDLSGYSIEELRGKDLNSINAKPLPEDTIQDMLQTLSEGKIWCGTTLKKRKNGSTFICDCKLAPLYDEKGQITSYIYTQHDITDRKEMEAKLQTQKQSVERILATIPDGVLVIDSNDRILLANKAFYRIFHLRKRTTENKLLNEIIRYDQLFQLYQAVKRGNKKNNTLEFRYQVQDIEKIITCNIIKMHGERILLSFTDISREREEEEKLYLTDRLASIGEMAAGLAHELNNPLTGILALSQLLIDSNLPEENKEDLECVYSEAKRAAGIVKNVLLFTRNNNYENGQASVNEVIRDILRLREYEETVSNITVVTNLQENLSDVPLDKFQLQQVFLNIILNAEAAIRETNRPGKLTVTTESANNHINIMFSDNGCGIKKHILPRIYDPFFTTKDIGKGTGLGLSICYGIVVKHGGKISVNSQPGEGTTFTVKFPNVSQTGKA